MLFLGQAANYSFRQLLRHTFSFGNSQDSQKLKKALAARYSAQPEDLDAVQLYWNGRSALTAALRATVPTGSAVIITGLTCIAVVRAVKAAKCTPIFADIDEETLQFNPRSIEDAINRHQQTTDIKGIIVQNTLGRTVEIDKIEKVAQQNGLVIIEDLAHSAGRYYPDGREVGTVGAASILSFGKGKAIDTITGGALILRQPAKANYYPPRPPRRRAKLGARLRARWYPILGKIIRGGYYIHLQKPITAVFLKLRWIERSADAELNLDLKLEHWQAKLAIKQLEQLPTTPLREGYLVRDREKLFQELEKHGYHLRETWYDTPVSPSRYEKEANFPTQACPETVKIAKEIINLPTYYPDHRLRPARKIIKKYQL